jgi:hypothetical protein
MPVDAPDGLAEAVLVVVIFGAILYVGLGAWGSIAAGIDASSGGALESYADSQLVSGGTVTLSGANISDAEVKQSLNDSAALDGSGAITGTLGDDVADNRTVSTWARVNNSTGVRQIVSVDSRTILVYNASTSEWACWSYDDASGETHRVAVADATPEGWTNLQCERAAGSLTLRVNDTSSATVQTDSANTTAETLQTTPLNGTVDETRVFNGTLTSSEQTALYSSPTAPLESADRQSRVMYDSYGGLDSIPVYFAGGSLDGTAASKGVGLQGQAAVEGTDWAISSDTISLLAGGTLAGAPVIFVSWLAGGGGVVLPGFTAGLSAAVGVFALIPTVIGVVIIIRYLPS